MKKGLAVIYDPHNLHQFIWYYCNEGKSKKWDALCLPNGYKGEYMHTYCERAGIFNNIFRDETNYSTMSAISKMVCLLKMLGYYLIGHSKSYCRKLLSQYVEWSKYDEVVVICAVGMVSGACVALGQEKRVVILEDGGVDYWPNYRKKWLTLKNMKSTYQWQGFILSHLGYCAPAWYYFKPEKYCIRYCGSPDKMAYRNYKELRQLYGQNGTDMELMSTISERMYPELSKVDFENVEAVVLTEALTTYVDDVDKYKKRLEMFINDNFHNIILKRHPREEGSYSFDDGVKVQELDNSIPAEAMLPYIKGKKVYTIGVCAVMMYFKPYNIDCNVIYFDGFKEDNMKPSSRFRSTALSYDQLVEYVRQFRGDDFKMLII